MSRSLAAVVLALVILAGVESAWAAPRDGAVVAQRGGPSRGGPGGAAPADARSLVRGEVKTVDAATGRVTVVLGGVDVDARLSPERAAEMKPGDLVYVTVNAIDTRIAAITGTVSAVDDQQGTATITTEHGDLVVRSSSLADGAMQPGDPVLLKLGIVDIGPPFKP